ncbi:ichor [Planococcus citri]|uniref:ichor n=1 Tax=Planococcus citri TaxID=170843 RepID=UPI0031F955C6
MKLSGGGDSEMLGMPVDTLLMNPWNSNNDFTNADVRRFLIGEDTKLTLGAADIDDDDDDNDIVNDQKPTIDDLDMLLTATTTSSTTTLSGPGPGGGPTLHHNNHNNNTLAELKPLPPFTGYTGHLSINGISGHHYHAIATAPNSAARIMVETNNNSVDTTNQNDVPYYSTDHVVSSSTMDNTIDSIKSESAGLEYGLHNDCIDDDFAAIISSAMADTTVPGNHAYDDDDTRDSWLDLDAFIVSHCGQSTSPTSSKTTVTLHSNQASNGPGGGGGPTNVLCPPDTLADFVTNSQFVVNPTPSQVLSAYTPQQQLKAQLGPQQQPQQQPSGPHHGQSRAGGGGGGNDLNAAVTATVVATTTFPHMPLLQSRLQNGPPKQEYAQDIGHGIVSECPSPSSSTTYPPHSPPCHVVSTSDIGFIQVHSSTRPSPELQVSFPHTTTPSKKSRNRAKSKVASSIVYNDGNLGKEKTVHRCNICNRGFLNKSNIKVHLRTHTGEKPFRCEVCGKAFRQKAHLIKHAQIHKRVGRD